MLTNWASTRRKSGTMTELEQQLLRRIDLMTRGVPFHVHVDPTDRSEWECSSPYCGALVREKSRGPARGADDA